MNKNDKKLLEREQCIAAVQREDDELLQASLEEDLEDFEMYPTVLDVDVKSENYRGAWPSLILGIIGSLGWIVPVIGLPVTVTGTVLGAMGMRFKKNRGISIAGFVVSIVFLTASIAKGIVDIVFYCKKLNK